eukprot:765990-Pyramimonas_sp.AAC.1
MVLEVQQRLGILQGLIALHGLLDVGGLGGRQEEPAQRDLPDVLVDPLVHLSQLSPDWPRVGPLPLHRAGVYLLDE